MSTTTGSAVRDTHEDRYLAEVSWHLLDVPRRQRKELLGLVAANLDERPTADSWDELVEALGAPADYASELRHERAIADRIGIRGRLGAAAWTTRVVIASVFLLTPAVAAGAFYWDHRQSSIDPGLENNCSGTQVGDPGVTVTDQQAGGVTEQRMSYVDGAEVRLGLCLSAADDIEIQQVTIPSLPNSLFHQVGTDATSMDAEEYVEDPPELVPAMIGPDNAGLRVDVILRLSDCEWYGAGLGNSVDTAEVTYRFRGHTRTETVDLNATYSFVSPSDEGCPRPRDHG